MPDKCNRIMSIGPGFEGMHYIATGSAFPIQTFYSAPNVFTVNETSITSFNPQNGSKICYMSSAPIKNACLLSNGNILLLEGASDSVFFNPKSKTIQKNVISRQSVSDIITITCAGDFVVSALASGTVLVFRVCGEELKFDKNIYLPDDPASCSLVSLYACLIEDKLAVQRFVSTGLDDTAILVDVFDHERTVSSCLHVIPGIKFAHMSAVIHQEDRIICLAIDNDCIAYNTYLLDSRRFKSCLFKIRCRTSNAPFSFITIGPNYNLNDSFCPSFFLFGPGAEVVMGIIYANTIKFWNVSSELEDIQSALYSEDSGLFFCSSLSKSAFMEIDIKGLKLDIIQYADAFFPFRNVISSAESNSFLCLSFQRDFIYKLGEGIYTKNRLSTDSIFKGTNGIWTLKKHYLDYCHAYILCSTAFSSTLQSIEDSTASEVTGLLGIDRNAPTLCIFNVPASSFVIQVTPFTITAFDFSKIDSANSDMIKNQINSSPSSAWKHVCYHQLLMACLAKECKSVSFFQIKNRPRDLDVVVPYGTYDAAELIRNHEVTCLALYSTADSVFLCIAIENGDMFVLELSTDLSLKSVQNYHFSAPVCTFKFYEHENGLSFVFGCRDGTWSATSCKTPSELLNRNRKQLGLGPLSIAPFLNDSLIIYGDSGAVMLSMEANDYLGRQSEIFEWSLSSACELHLRPEEPWIVGIDSDCLTMMALNRSKTSTLSKKVIFNNSKIFCFDRDESLDVWIIGHREEADNKCYISAFSSTGSLLFSFDEGINEPVQIIKHPRSSTFIVISHSRSDSCSTIQIFTLHKDKFEIVNEFICSGLIHKGKFDRNTILCCINDELIGVEVCPNFLNFPRRSSFHFRNKIIDFDVADGWVVVSTLSDGLDVLSVISNEEQFGFKHLKGDPLSRTCLACLWAVPGERILYSDKKGFVGFTKAAPESRFLIDDQHWSLNETGTFLYRQGSAFFVQTISGGIVKIEE